MNREQRTSSRLRGYAVVAAVSTVIGVALTTWVRFGTDITRGVWAVLLLTGLAVVLMVAGQRAVKR